MSPDDLRRFFPNASPDLLKKNAGRLLHKKVDQLDVEKRAEVFKEPNKIHVHPKGVPGKTHSQEAGDSIRAGHIGKKKMSRYGDMAPSVKRGSWKASWREIGGVRKFYRSRWEANYARYLELQKQNGLIKDWKHENEVFWFAGIKRGCVSYLPDFKVTLNDDSVEYHEVKGWMDSESKTKIKRMAKYHPQVILKVFDSKWYKENSRKLSLIVPGWE